MKRRLLNLLTALSLLLCLCAALASVIALRERDPYLRGYDVFQPLEPPRSFTGAEIRAFHPQPPVVSFAGFRVQRGFRAEYLIQYGRVYTIPFWFLSAVLGVPPAVWLRARWQERRRERSVRMFAAGVCPVCGYDLRATPGRCPECGAAPVTMSAPE
jgi:hypothetical protein